ncbi:MAG: hypothetical protein H7Y07_16155, partial [Pyrinomonadaceae bacterium]|nr:hypothetical protein [Sphingobacteriaceae bacterium]
EEIPDDQWLNTQLQDTDILPSAIEDEETLDNTEGITTFFEEKAQNTGSTNFIEEEEQVKDENETTLSDDGIKDVSDSDQSPQTEIAHADEISNFTESLEVPEQTEIQHEFASEDQEEVMKEEVVSEKLVEEDETVAELTEPELEAPESVKEEDFHTEIEEVSNLEQQIPLIADEDAQTNIEERVEETAIYEPQASIRPILPVTPFENTIETVIPDSDHLQFDEQIKENTIEENDIVKENPLLQNEIIGSVASTNFFVFDHSSVDPLLKEEVDEKAESATFPSTPQIRQGEVAKYDDDKMPFSFLWWLDKTRKEHADNLQPYAAKGSTSIPAKKDTSGQLNQQILENIYHIQPEINVFQNQFAKPISFGIKRKEDAIIEKFIIEDPQIRPPKDDKLDTENKARKSSEDNLDMVSETLAKIYTDQMLYHKAIDTYRKLSLKFPEKSTYFAGRIRELEKKFN